MKANRFIQSIRAHKTRGVSPVIGIILMVAITVILAALVGSFVLDIGQSAKDDAPQASFRVTADPAANETELEHLGGEELRHDQTRVVVESNGTTTFEPVSGVGSESILSVGEIAVINLTSSDTLDFDGDGMIDATTNGAAGPFEAGDRVTVTLIDTGTERVIFEGTILVQS